MDNGIIPASALLIISPPCPRVVEEELDSGRYRRPSGCFDDSRSTAVSYTGITPPVSNLPHGPGCVWPSILRISCDCQSVAKPHLRGVWRSVSLPSFCWSSNRYGFAFLG